MLQSLATGALLTVLTIGIHSSCTTAWIRYLRSRESKFQHRFGDLIALSSTAIALLLIHTIEVFLWAIAYYWLVGAEVFQDLESAIYFSTVTFTSLGYGDIVIEGPWRMLCAIQVMTGILIFGWSTALLFAVVQKIWQRKFG